MRYSKRLEKGETIGICAPSSGVPPHLLPRLEKAVKNVEALGYRCVLSLSVTKEYKCTSADVPTRAAEFMAMYKDPAIAAIMPPWGGEFLMEILPLLPFEEIAALAPKWVCGYSDLSALTFPLTLLCDMATIHGSNFMNMGAAEIHQSDLLAFEAMQDGPLAQQSAPFWGDFYDFDNPETDMYDLNENSTWKSLDGAPVHQFSGRVIGGCMDVLVNLAGTAYAPVDAFIEKYKADGIVWTLESCEMAAPDIYRALWHMREHGWFRHCSGVLYGRPGGYAPKRGFALQDALARIFDELGVPVLYDADIGHIPPQMQLVNGALVKVAYANGQAAVLQEYKL